ncbi:MAG: hypothetical protein AAB250_19630, partial [Bdellovibrionota bacterium]
MVIVQTPVRISFFGGGTDYPVWFKENGGAVLATAIDKYIYTSVRPLPAFHDHKHRLIYSKIEDVCEVDQIQHPAVREVFRYMEVKNGIELHHDCDLPARSGLGSSSSFVVGLLHALHAQNGEAVDKKMLSRESIHVEQDMIGENVGCQDQIMAAYGGFNVVHFHQDGSFRLDPVIMRAPRMTEFHSHLMLFYTGISRIASVVAAEQIKNTPKKATELQAMHQMVREGIGILGSSSPITDFGKLLHEGWVAKNDASAMTTKSMATGSARRFMGILLRHRGDEHRGRVLDDGQEPVAPHELDALGRVAPARVGVLALDPAERD